MQFKSTGGSKPSSRWSTPWLTSWQTKRKVPPRKHKWQTALTKGLLEIQSRPHVCKVDVATCNTIEDKASHWERQRNRRRESKSITQICITERVRPPPNRFYSKDLSSLQAESAREMRECVCAALVRSWQGRNKILQPDSMASERRVLAAEHMSE
jgi:hypothetical protein